MTTDRIEKIEQALLDLTLLLKQQEESRLLEGKKRRAEDEKRRAEDEKRRAEDEKRRAEDEKRRVQNEKLWAETERERERDRKAAEKRSKELDKKIGELGNSIGDIAEGMIRPSMERVLQQKFKITRIAESAYKINEGGEELEFDVFGYANGEANTAVVVEAKSRAKDEHVDTFLDRLSKVKTMLPEHKDKKLIGILAALQMPKPVMRRAQKRGLYVAMVHDETFDLKEPVGFVPRDFNK